jgi:hypothetical protein
LPAHSHSQPWLLSPCPTTHRAQQHDTPHLSTSKPHRTTPHHTTPHHTHTTSHHHLCLMPRSMPSGFHCGSCEAKFDKQDVYDAHALTHQGAPLQASPFVCLQLSSALQLSSSFRYPRQFSSPLGLSSALFGFLQLPSQLFGCGLFRIRPLTYFLLGSSTRLGQKSCPVCVSFAPNRLEAA